MYHKLSIIKLLNEHLENRYQNNFHIKRDDISCGAATYSVNTINFIINNYKYIYFPYLCFRPLDKIEKGIQVIRSNLYYQFQILIKNNNEDGCEIFSNIMKQILPKNIFSTLEFLPDDWSASTMNAIGYGYEARLCNLEVAQITYFRKFGNIDISNLHIIEIAIGVERIDMLINDYRCINLFTDYYTFPSNIKKYYKHNSSEMKKIIDLNLEEKTYVKFLDINNIFNILDYNNSFSDSEKNVLMHKISSMFNHVFYKIYSEKIEI